MLIRRARPKYITSDMLKDIIKIDTKENQELYFNRGSSALKFLLQSLVNHHNKKLTLCLQAFNCDTVLEAALEVDNLEILLSDVKLEDYSISFDFIQENYQKIDILLLLHYQGMYNKEYESIIKFCKLHNIIVIEDLAHIVEKENQIKGNYGIYSYSFDKPFTCMYGGKIVAVNQNSSEYTCIINQYNNIEYESFVDNQKDLYLLQ